MDQFFSVVARSSSLDYLETDWNDVRWVCLFVCLFVFAVLLRTLLGHGALSTGPRVPQTSGQGRRRPSAHGPLSLVKRRAPHQKKKLVSFLFFVCVFFSGFINIFRRFRRLFDFRFFLSFFVASLLPFLTRPLTRGVVLHCYIFMERLFICFFSISLSLSLSLSPSSTSRKEVPLFRS